VIENSHGRVVIVLQEPGVRIAGKDNQLLIGRSYNSALNSSSERSLPTSGSREPSTTRAGTCIFGQAGTKAALKKPELSPPLALARYPLPKSNRKQLLHQATSSTCP